jgi:hypothetical protein
LLRCRRTDARKIARSTDQLHHRNFDGSEVADHRLGPGDGRDSLTPEDLDEYIRQARQFRPRDAPIPRSSRRMK